MGQRANSNRNASLDDQKRRNAGRSGGGKSPNPLRDDRAEQPAKGKTAGAFGKGGKANRTAGGLEGGGGGGGGGFNSMPKDSLVSHSLRSKKK
jgi:hypothetical protein